MDEDSLMSQAKAILCLDDLTVLQFANDHEYDSAKLALERVMRPHVTLKFRLLPAHRFAVWHPCETRFYDPKIEVVRYSELSPEKQKEALRGAGLIP